LIKQSLYQDALDILYRDTVQSAVEEAGFEPIALENIDVDGTLEKGKPVTFKVTFVVEPEAELGEYKGLEYEAVETTVTDEEVTAELDALQQQGAELAVKEGAIENGDTAVFDFAGFADGEQFEGGTAENYTLEIGSGQFIPGFEEQMVGMTAGEEKDVEVTFPEEYHADNLAGKPATFKVKLHEVKAKQVPELDDEFAKDIDESVSSLDELKAKIRERLEAGKKQEADGTMRDQLVEQATANATIDVPAVLVEQEVDRMVQEFGTRVSSQGIDLNMYFELTGTSEDAMREEMKEQAEERVKARLVLKAIAEKEAIEVSDEDAEKELEEMSKLLKKSSKKCLSSTTSHQTNSARCSRHKAESRHLKVTSSSVKQSTSSLKTGKRSNRIERTAAAQSSFFRHDTLHVLIFDEVICSCYNYCNAEM